MPKGLRSLFGISKKGLREKQISSQAFDPFGLKIWQNTYGMVLNNSTDPLWYLIWFS